MTLPTGRMTATKFVTHVENRLGWFPNENIPTRTRYAATARKVEERMTEDPDLYTWRNLYLAVELLAREKISRSPLGVFAHVERALKLARENDGDLESKIREAVRIEYHRGDPDGWITMFSRCTGSYRREVYDEWLAARKP